MGAAPFLLPGSAGIDDGEYEVIVEETIRLFKFVLTSIHLCTHAESLAVDHAFQNAHGLIQPLILLVLCLKGGEEKLLAGIPIEKGASV